ncbi:protein NPGR1-like isoform X2 [Wolffia australiana]
MLCACSGDQVRFDDAPPPASISGSGDFSFCGLADRDRKVDDVESTLKETVSLTYEEARALLGRLEFQNGNFSAALHVLRGIDVAALKSDLVNALAEWARPSRPPPKTDTPRRAAISPRAAALLLEAILLKSKALAGLGLVKEAAEECGVVMDIAEAAFPRGMAAAGERGRLRELVNEAVTLGCEMNKRVDFEAVDFHRRVLALPWNLPPQKLADVQKSLAALLLHGGADPAELEESLVLLAAVVAKMAAAEIPFDREAVDQLAFALSVSGEWENLSRIFELAPPGIYDRRERWYLLALCAAAAGEDAAALNLLRKAAERRPHPTALMLAAEICGRRKELVREGVAFSRSAAESAVGRRRHRAAAANRLLGLCCGGAARASTSDSDRTGFYALSRKALADAMAADGDDPAVNLTFALESAARRDSAAARTAAAKYVDLVAGSSVKGWEVLVHAAASEEDLKKAEDIVDFALEETEPEDQLVLLRMKGALQSLQGNSKQAVNTYRMLLTLVSAKSQLLVSYRRLKAGDVAGFEMDTWLDLTAVYRDLGSWSDSEVCLTKAMSISGFSPRAWYERGRLLQARGQMGDAMGAFFAASSLDPDGASASMAALAAPLARLGQRGRPTARSLLTNALRLDPMSHVAWLGLGHVYKKEGSLALAADCFQAAVEIFLCSPLEVH